MKQLCVQAGEQRCHAGCWESSLLLPDDWHSCSSAVTPFPSTIALHGLVLSAPGRLPRCIVLLLHAHLENKATSSKSPSLHGGRAVWARTCTGSCSFLDEDKDLFYLPSTIFNTRLNVKQKKERVSSVGDLGKVGQQLLYDRLKGCPQFKPHLEYKYMDFWIR